MLARAAGIEATYVGKPSPFAFEMPIKSMELDKSRVLVVGDRVATDIKGAKALGMKSVLICTGEFVAKELDGSVEPDYILNDVTELLELL